MSTTPSHSSSGPIWKQPGYNPALDENNNFDFVPSKGLGFAFVIMFSILTFGHLVLLIKTRKWWLTTMVVGGLVEILGWVGRLWGAYNPDSYNAFMIQIVCLIFAPAFLGAAIYAMMKWVIMAVGPEYSYLKPASYWKIFITCDFISLVVQSGGGGVAASSNDQNVSNIGSNIMLAGIIFQLIATIIFGFVLTAFLRRLFRDPEVNFKEIGRIKWLLAAIAVSALLIILRGIYRTVELAQKWNGFLFIHQYYFLFDALPMVFLMLVTLVAHPYFTLFNNWQIGDPPVIERISSKTGSKQKLMMTETV